MRTCVIIPSYCSWKNLEKNLPALLDETRPRGIEIFVSDDASPDETADSVEREFPDVHVLRRDTNGGFGINCNWAILAVEGFERVLLLNSDVSVTPGFLEPLERAFDTDDVFAVSPIAVDPADGRPTDGPRFAVFRRGLLKWRQLELERIGGSPGLLGTLYPVGAHVLLDRAKFIELGGFDPLFRPFYWEDVDLGYRALKRGWRVFVEPGSRVHHLHEDSDIERVRGTKKVARTIYRNRFLFLWKNIHDRRLFWTSHVLPIGLRSLYALIRLDGRFYRALFSALGRLAEVRAARRRARAESRRSDAEVFDEVERALADLLHSRPRGGHGSGGA